MEKVILKPIQHRGEECIGIYFEKNAIIQNLIQKNAGAKWSRTLKCWYVLLSKNNYEVIAKALNGKVQMRMDELKKHLLLKRGNSIPVQKELLRTTEKLKLPKHTESISKDNELEFIEYKNRLILKGYSPSTIRTYCNEFQIFLQTLNKKSAKELTPEQLQRYILYCINQLKLSENTIHSRINSLKFYYEQVLHKEKMFFEIPRPRKQKLLPGIFSQDEIAAIINSVINKKHKAMLMIAYSGGLRVSEIVTLKTYQIDSKRMTIFISQAKGKKDRVVTLSPILLVMLREYAKEYNPDKKGYLFGGSIPGTPYSTRSLQEVMQAAKKKAGVMKPGSMHSLRHSFATHLIERGTDVTMIQKLLGHNDLKTTLIYLHTSNKDLMKIISPLDDLTLT